MLQIPIVLDNDKARSLAFDAISRLYQKNNTALDLQPANVYALNIGTVDFTIAGLDSLGLGALVINSPVSFLTPPNSFTINIDAPSKDVADQLELNIPHLRVDYSVSFNAKSTKTNIIKLNYKDLRNSTLFNTLNGLNSTEAFVHRDDLKKLTNGINTQLNLSEIIEDPDHFDADIFNKILNAMTTVTNTETSQFNAEKWAATYNADDLKPDVISNSLNKAFDFDQGSHQAKRSGSVDTGGKVELLDVLSAEGKFAGSFSTDDLQTWLKQHSVETSFTGNKIVVKSIDLQRVNMSAFSQDSQFSSIITLVSSGLVQEKGSMDFGRLLEAEATGMPLPGLVADLASQVSTLRGRLTPIDNKVTMLSTQFPNLQEQLNGLKARAKIIPRLTSIRPT